MALKTFNIDAEVYDEFSKHCKKNGISMSKKVEKFIASEIENLKSGDKEMRDKVEEERQKRIREENNEHPLGKYC